MMNPNTHIYLYAKGHYVCGDMISDLQEIISHRNNISPQYVSVEDIINTLTKIVYYHLRDSNNTERFFMDFIGTMLPNNRWKLTNRKDLSYEELMMLNCLSVIRMVSVDGLDLGEATNNILEVSDWVDGGEILPMHEDDDMAEDEDNDLCASLFSAEEYLELDEDE